MRAFTAGLIIVGSMRASGVGAADRADIETRRVIASYSACVVNARHDRAAEAILANADNEEIIKRYGDLIDSDCMGKAGGSVSVTFGGDFFRYALADALVNRDFGKGGPSDLSDRLPLAHVAGPDPSARDAALAKAKGKRQRNEVEKRYTRAYSVVLLSRYGECIVRHDPAAARLWLLTRPDVPEEMSRIGALRPAFNDCLDEGTVTFTKPVMRGLVAINYYRLAMATPQPALSKVK